MDGLDCEHLAEVVKACTNLELAVGWSAGKRLDWRYVHELGPCVARIAFIVDSLQGKEYPIALQQCSNLREIRLSGGFNEEIPDDMIANVFAPSRFPKLEQLSVQYVGANKWNMGRIASCTTNLKSAVLQPFDKDLDRSLFQLFADSNMHLEDITTHTVGIRAEDRSDKPALESLNELVKTFRKCRKLSFILSTASGEQEVCTKDLVNICKVLPCRDVDVHVQIDYISYRYPN